MSQGVAWILCSNRWNSAITEYALSTARALRLNGWTVFFSGLADSPGERRARAYDLPGDSFVDFGLKESLKLRRLKKSINPDAVLLFGGPESFLARFIPRTLRVRFRGQDKDVTDPLPPLKTRLNMQHCVAMLVPARILEERFQNIVWQPVWPVTLGIDTGKFYFQPDAFAEVRPSSASFVRCCGFGLRIARNPFLKSSAKARIFPRISCVAWLPIIGCGKGKTGVCEPSGWSDLVK